jgi:uncharacterized protein (TIRG00374 family)
VPAGIGHRSEPTPDRPGTVDRVEHTPGRSTSSTPADAEIPVPGTETPPVWKRAVAAIVTLVVLVVVFVGIFPRFADYSKAWASIQTMSAAAVGALVLASIVNVFVYVLPYQAALPTLGYWHAFVVRQTSFTISNAIPAGGAIGLGVQYAMLGGYGVGPAPATAAIGITSVWNLLVTLVLPVLGVLAVVFQDGATTNQVLGAVGGVVAVGLLVGVFALVLRSDAAAHRIGGIGDRLLHRVRPRTEGTPATDGIVRFRDSTVDVIRSRWQLLTVTNFAQQLMQCAVLVVAVFGLGGESTGVNVLEVFAAFSIARLAGFIPVTPGGLGTVDAAMVALLVSFGMDNDQALAATLLWRAASYFPQVFMGVVTFLVWRVQSGRSAATAARSATK